MNISVRALNLKKDFKDIHHTEIVGVSGSVVDYAVFLNIWESEEYKSLILIN
jgi:hypothetical protein